MLKDKEELVNKANDAEEKVSLFFLRLPTPHSTSLPTDGPGEEAVPSSIFTASR